MFRVTNRQSRCCSRHGDEIPIEMEIATVSDLHRQTSNGFPFCRQDDRQWPAAKPFVKSTHLEWTYYHTGCSTSTTAILDLWPTKQDVLFLYLLRLYYRRFIVRRRVRLDRLMGHLRNQRITPTTIRTAHWP